MPRGSVLRDELIPVVRFADVLESSERTAISKYWRRRTDDRRHAAGGSPLARAQRFARHQAGPAPGNFTSQCQAADRRQNASSDIEIVVVTVGAMKYGLVVDHFHTGEEIVVKPWPPPEGLSRIPRAPPSWVMAPWR